MTTVRSVLTLKAFCDVCKTPWRTRTYCHKQEDGYNCVMSEMKKQVNPASYIVERDHPVLRAVARTIEKEEIGTPALSEILRRMNAALDSQDDGVAIAAPQIGESLRIFIISKKAYGLGYGSEERDIPKTNTVFINPKITKLSRERKDMEEGCLSVRHLYGIVKRAQKASIEAWDEEGKKFTRGGSGLIAEIFQHETDHLEGVLFIDKARDIRDLPPPSLSKKA